MAADEEIANEDRPKAYLETVMRDNEIIAGIRETRRAFAAEHGNDLRAISEAAMKLAMELGFKPVAMSSNPNFHYPTSTVAAV